MKVLVCGSRHFNDYELLESVLDKIDITTLIHGAARGADTLGGEYAKRRGINAIAFPADWHQYGRSAGPIRNYKMLKEGQPDCVIAFLHENSRGTRHMIEIARKADIEVKVINI